MKNWPRLCSGLLDALPSMESKLKSECIMKDLALACVKLSRFSKDLSPGTPDVTTAAMFLRTKTLTSSLAFLDEKHIPKCSHQIVVKEDKVEFVISSRVRIDELFISASDQMIT